MSLYRLLSKKRLVADHDTEQSYTSRVTFLEGQHSIAWRSEI
jgi:hypothetical protein